MNATGPRTMRSTFTTLLRPAAFAATLLAAGSALAQYRGSDYGPNPYNTPPPPYPYFGDNAPPGYGRSPAYYGQPRPLRPGEVVDRLEDQGYDDVGRPRFNGTGVYMVDATAPGGMRVRLAVDAIRGVILNRTAIEASRFGRLPDDEDDEDRPARRRGARLPPGAAPYGPGDVDPGRPGGYAYRAPPDRAPAEAPLGRGPVEQRPLPPPADSRLQPPDGGQARAPDRRRDRDEANRGRPDLDGSPDARRPFGTNPQAGSAPKAGKPSRQARRPATATEPQEKEPAATPTSPGSAATPAASEDGHNGQAARQPAGSRDPGGDSDESGQQRGAAEQLAGSAARAAAKYDPVDPQTRKRPGKSGAS